jgi:hypothetical protein
LEINAIEQHSSQDPLWSGLTAARHLTYHITGAIRACIDSDDPAIKPPWEESSQLGIVFEERLCDAVLSADAHVHKLFAQMQDKRIAGRLPLVAQSSPSLWDEIGALFHMIVC